MESILVVDDYDSMRELIVRRVRDLTQEAYRILEAKNGEEGIGLIDQHTPILVITDYQMPIKNGEEVIKYIRKNHPTIKTILVSGEWNPMEIAERSGADGFVEKSLLFDSDLKNKVSQLLGLDTAPLSTPELTKSP